jgi:hypothetical protein
VGDAGDAGASVWEETVGGVPVTWRRYAAMSDLGRCLDHACCPELTRLIPVSNDSSIPCPQGRP